MQTLSLRRSSSRKMGHGLRVVRCLCVAEAAATKTKGHSRAAASHACFMDTVFSRWVLFYPLSDSVFGIGPPSASLAMARIRISIRSKSSSSGIRAFLSALLCSRPVSVVGSFRSGRFGHHLRLPWPLIDKLLGRHRLGDGRSCLITLSWTGGGQWLVCRVIGRGGMRCRFGPCEDRAVAGGRSLWDGLRGIRRVASDFVFRDGTGRRSGGSGARDIGPGSVGTPGSAPGGFVGRGAERGSDRGVRPRQLTFGVSRTAWENGGFDEHERDGGVAGVRGGRAGASGVAAEFGRCSCCGEGAGSRAGAAGVRRDVCGCGAGGRLRRRGAAGAVVWRKTGGCGAARGGDLRAIRQGRFGRVAGLEEREEAGGGRKECGC